MTLEEFKKLRPEQRGEAYKELSDHDKFLVRISEPLKPKRLFKSDLTPSQFEDIHKDLLKGLKEGRVTQEDYDEFMNN